jgi:UDP-glucuronate decarboxylase
MINHQNTIINSDFKFIYNKINKKKFFKNKSVLITGSEGFIGNYLKNFFLKYFNNLQIKKIICCDLKIKKNSNNKTLREINSDFLNQNFIIKDYKPDIIIHAATYASPILYRKKPLETAFANITGLKKILEYSINNSKISILFFSTSEIYGDPDTKNIPTKESYNGNVSCVGPRSCYDESKRFCETLCYIYSKKYKTSVKVARPFNNFGPGLSIRDGRLPADLALSIIKRDNIKIYSNGKPTRSFCYIADAIIGYLNLIPLKKYDVFNIGNNSNETSALQLAKIYQKKSEKIFNFKPKIYYKINKDKDYLVNSPNRRCPNIDKAKKKIKYVPKIDLSNGIERYLKFLKEENVK